MIKSTFIENQTNITTFSSCKTTIPIDLHVRSLARKLGLIREKTKGVSESFVANSFSGFH